MRLSRDRRERRESDVCHRLLVLLLAFLPLPAAIWPEKLGPAQRLSARTIPISDLEIWREYGLEEAEQARYELAGKEFTASAWRLADATSAMAAFQWRRTPLHQRTQQAPLFAASPTGALLCQGNYLLEFEGRQPGPAELVPLSANLPRLDESPLPALPDFLPKDGLVAGSERYVLGPASLERFEPRIAPSLAAFHLGAEAQIARFAAPSGELRLALFSYPTPQLARERLVEFQKLAGLVAKRSGPLVAVILSPPGADDAERLLAKVRYQASISWSERMPTRRDNIGDLIVNVFILIGVLLGFCAVAGLAFGGLRAFLRRGRTYEDEAMITLHLDRR
ncbi:MAG: DUF6599 family protein [Bryobacteraceae bacterium]